jgi:DNA/RNA endonuclease YhcR with UshA esterase domain
MMKRIYAGSWAMSLAALFLMAIPVHAQTAAATANSTRPLSYNISEEVTLKGTVSSVQDKPAKGMMMGSHLLLQTPAGTVDASLGMFGLRGKGALSVSEGQQVEVTGVMKTIRSQQVFLARTVKANGQTFVIRNEHGFPVSPQARERASQNAKQNGEGL